MKKLGLFLLVLLIIPFSKAIICNSDLPNGCPQEVVTSSSSSTSSTNYSSVNVNNSQYLQGFTPSTLPTYNVTYHGLINNASYLSTYNLTYHNKNSSVFLLNGASAYYNGGNVGIGTVAPTQKLDVSAAMGDGTIPFLASTVSDTTRGFRVTSGIISTAPYDVGGLWATTATPTLANAALLADNSGNTYFNAATGQGIYFQIANAHKMVLDLNGNVGIGTTSPNQKLVVVGSTNSTGGYIVNGSVGISGTYQILKDVDLIGLTKTYCNQTFTGGILTATTC